MVATCWMRMECGRRKGVRLPGSSLGSELCGLSSVAFLSHLWGLLSAPLCTHGLLRGLHSFAASRLTAFPAFRSSKRNCAATQVAAGLWVRVERQVWLLGALQARSTFTNAFWSSPTEVIQREGYLADPCSWSAASGRSPKGRMFVCTRRYPESRCYTSAHWMAAHSDWPYRSTPLPSRAECCWRRSYCAERPHLAAGRRGY